MPSSADDQSDASDPQRNQDDVLEFLNSPAEASLDDLAEGAHFCWVNASSLLRDARALRDVSPSRAVALAILALEEIGKILLLWGLALRSDGRPVSGKDVRSELRSHSLKQSVIAFYGAGGMMKFDDRLHPEWLPLLDRIKQLCLYVDLAGAGFLSPDQFGVDNPEIVDWVVEVTRERIEKFERPYGSKEEALKFLRIGIASAKAMPALADAIDRGIGEEAASALFQQQMMAALAQLGEIEGPKDPT